jgi:hypothetical protein
MINICIFQLNNESIGSCFLAETRTTDGKNTDFGFENIESVFFQELFILNI